MARHRARRDPGDDDRLGQLPQRLNFGPDHAGLRGAVEPGESFAGTNGWRRNPVHQRAGMGLPAKIEREHQGRVGANE